MCWTGHWRLWLLRPRSLQRSSPKKVRRARRRRNWWSSWTWRKPSGPSFPDTSNGMRWVRAGWSPLSYVLNVLLLHAVLSCISIAQKGIENCHQKSHFYLLTQEVIWNKWKFYTPFCTWANWSVLFPEAACHYLPLISDGWVINSLPSHSKHLTVALGEEELEVEPSWSPET